MGKNKKVMLSNWAAPLSDEQIFYAGLDAWAGAACYEVCSVGWPEAFSQEKVRAVLEREMPVSELASRFKARRSAKAELSRLKRIGLGWESEEAGPSRRKLEGNRPEKVPLFPGVDIAFEQARPKEGGRAGEGWGRTKRGQARKGQREEVAEEPVVMSVEEMDVIANAIKDIEGFDYLMDD